MTNNQNGYVLSVIVLAVVGATLYMAVKNNNMEVVNSLATAIIGYYFGKQATGGTRGPSGGTGGPSGGTPA